MALTSNDRPADRGRRRVLTLMAASAGSLFFPRTLLAGPGEGRRWQGRALGADASILLFHPSEKEADALIEACVAEIERLEAIFSLHRRDSALARWNAAGELAGPPRDLIELTKTADNFRLATGGAFDITVQPLWTLLANHNASGGDASGPTREALERTLAQVGGAGIRIKPDRIAFARPGMAATFNGIAQGYITDRITSLLKDAGLSNVLLDLGEYRAIGGKPSGEPWRLGIADAQAPWRVVERVSVRDRAIATSSPWGTTFDNEARFNHLIDPRSGFSASDYLSVTVVADDAVTADALSTALSLTSLDDAQRIAAAYPGVEILIRKKNGDFARFNA